MKFQSDVVIPAATALAASVASESVQTETTIAIAFQALVAGTGITTGVLQLQGSAQTASEDPGDAFWVNVGSSVSVGVTGGMYEVPQPRSNWEYKRARVVYTQAAGSGTITAWMTKKGF